MSKKLPAIYRSEGTKNRVNKEIFYSFHEEKQEEHSPSSQEESSTKTSIETTLDTIFKGRGYAFNVPVFIKLPGREIHTFLAARNKSNLLTLDDEVIPIASILELKIKKP